MSTDLAPKVREGRAPYVVIPLLILQLVLLSLQIEDPSGTLLFRSWALAAQAPFLNATSNALGGIRHVWWNYIWMLGARAENERLQETIRQLSLQKNAYEQIGQENVRLRRLLSLTDGVSFETISARVVARTPSFMSNVIYIDRGFGDGIAVDAPVISGDGIVGRIVLVSHHDSQVQLITNPDASIGVMAERTRCPGVLRGSGDVLMDLDFISNTEHVDVGDDILSSGLDGIYPKGIRVGKVVDSRKGKTVFRSIKVEPSVDLVRLEEVSIFLNNLKQEKASYSGKANR